MSEEFSKLFYRIGDASELLALPSSTLRYWEKEFSELRPRRNAGGLRLYSANDMELLRLIRFLLYDKGLTIDGAKEHLKHNRADIERKHMVVERLRAMRRQLTTLLDAIDTRK